MRGPAFGPKRCSAALLCAALLFLLPACGSIYSPAVTTAAAEPATQAPAPTTEPETTAAPPPSYPFAPIPDQEPPGQSHEPLRQGEMVIENASINDIVKRFGAYESYETARDGYSAVVGLKYPNLYVKITGASFSFDQGDDYW
ncbi:MAG: hypothetical protein FWF60_00090 [Oscillospiraceae bacterium]|nr:hypothetical protein [Oscillospiraceae bacterium]